MRDENGKVPWGGIAVGAAVIALVGFMLVRPTRGFTRLSGVTGGRRVRRCRCGR